MRRQSAIMMNNRRLMSTQTHQVRQGGINKGLVAALVVAAAGFTYYRRTVDEKSKLNA